MENHFRHDVLLEHLPFLKEQASQDVRLLYVVAGEHSMDLLNSGLDHVAFNRLDYAPKDRLLFIQINQFLISRIQ